jgi:hypothetical protein
LGEHRFARGENLPQRQPLALRRDRRPMLELKEICRSQQVPQVAQPGDQRVILFD